MNPSKISVRRASFLLASMLVGTSLFGAADDTTTAAAVPANTTTSAASAAPSQNEEITRLKAALAEQQKELQALQQMLKNQQQLIEKVTGTTAAPAAATVAASSPAPAASAPTSAALRPNLGDVASLVPVLPVLPAPSAIPVSIAAPEAKANPQAGSTQNAGGGNPCEAPPDANQIPPYIRIGNVCAVPVGFMDLTPFWRDKNAGSSMGSNFGSVPYNNVANGNLSETKFTLQNSRLGFRIDGDWKGAHFIGYNEFDFNGTGGAANMQVTNGAIVPRLRLYWVDVRKNGWEFLGGQSWSMLTPNRRGLSALPGDLFYGQEIDINYLAGLTWSRQGGARIIYHAGDKVALGFSVEQPDNYMGGSAGGSAAVLPAALTGLATTQLDNGAGLSSSPAGSYLSTPTLMPDFLAKLAFDPNSRFHFEVGGVVSAFELALNQNATTGAVSIAAPYNLHPKTEGAGLLAGFNVGLTQNLRVISTNFWNLGEGRYLFGQAPDVIVNANGSLSALHSAATIDGLEATIKNTLLYAYYGGIYLGRDVVIDATGKPVGFGYTGSANSQNREISEITFGFNQTMWRNPRYGAINFMGQYEWLKRAPWYVAAGSPDQTHDSTIYLDLRYTLPGSMPNF